MSSKLSDLVLPFSVVMVVAIMVVPLPSFLLDVLLVLNIGFALLLLISSVYLAKADSFTSLPSILLLATLFRLGLNIATTRAILTSGQAPDVISAFGSFVVSGNLVVGIVIFLILTLVQFLVIAKGAERVAEVSARFTLDSLPGKQMSIDADLRAGIIGLEEAKRRREDLHRESKLYGALDGAMKFVKGDSIAGILITSINVCAGLFIGVSQLGMSFSFAAEKYTILSIGDGLVAQIPALLVAVAAGISITRVSGGEESLLGSEMLTQLTSKSEVLLASGVMLVLMSFVPGMPYLVFILLGSTVIYFSRQKGNELGTAVEQVLFNPVVSYGFLISLDRDSYLKIKNEARLENYLEVLKGEVFQNFGVVVPESELRMAESLDSKIEISLNSEVILDLSQIEGDTSLSEKVIDSLQDYLENNLFLLIDDTQTRILLEVHQASAEDLINSVVPNKIGITALSSILKQLVLERISIKEFRKILQAIAEYHSSVEDGDISGTALSFLGGGLLPSLREQSPKTLRQNEILAHVRVALSTCITKSLSMNSEVLRAYILSFEVDRKLTESIITTLPLSPNFIVALMKELDSIEVGTVVFATKLSRIALANLVLSQGKKLKVLAVDEISSELSVEIIAEIDIGDEQEIVECIN